VTQLQDVLLRAQRWQYAALALIMA